MTISREHITQAVRWVIVVCLAAALAVPLLMSSQYFFPFIVPRHVAFRLAVELAVFGYGVLVLLDARWLPPRSRVLKLVVALAAVTALSTVIGINPLRSFWGNYERMAGLVHTLHLTAFVVVLASVLRTRRDWTRLLTLSVFVSVLMSWVGWSQHFTTGVLLSSAGDTRIAGTVGNPTFLAAYLLLHLFFIGYFLAAPRRFDLKLFAGCFLVVDALLVVSQALAFGFGAIDWGWANAVKLPILAQAWGAPVLFWPFVGSQIGLALAWRFRQVRGVVRGLLVLLAGFEFFIFYHTQTRGALIGFWVGVLLVAIAAAVNSASTRATKLTGRLAVVGLLIIPAMIWLGRGTPLVQSSAPLMRLATISLTDITTESRLLTWQASWQGWTTSPKTFLFGLGPENYAYAFNAHFPVQIFRDPGSQIWFDRAHNIIFDIGLTTGAVGLAVYFALVVLALGACWKRFSAHSDGAALVLGAGLVAAVVQNLFVFDTLNSELPFFFAIGMVSFFDQQRVRTAQRAFFAARPASFAPALAGICGILFVFSIGSLVMNVRTVEANRTLFSGLVASAKPVTPPSAVAAMINRASELSVIGRFEAREQLAVYAMRLLTNTQVPREVAAGVANQAVAGLRQSITEEPLNARHYLSLAELLSAFGRVAAVHAEKSLEVIDDGLRLSPARPQFYFVQGRAYLTLGKIPQAVTAFRRGVALAPWVIDSQQQLLALYAVIGDAPSAADQIEEIRLLSQGNIGAEDVRRITAALRAGKQDELLAQFLESTSDSTTVNASQ